MSQQQFMKMQGEKLKFLAQLSLLLHTSAAVTRGNTLHVAFITDLHLGEHCSDLSYAGCKSVRNLADAVAHLPAIEQKFGVLDGVFVSGDITSSATLEQYSRAREILDGIKYPWWPLLGNHDAWPYVKHSDGSFDQTDTAIGDSYFGNTFQDILSGSVGMSPKPAHWPQNTCVNPDYGFDSWFHNFEITFDKMPSLTFLALDWVSRGAALPEPGVGPEVELHDYPCGSYQWLGERLADWKQETLEQGQEAYDEKRFFLVQHYPFHNRDIIDPFGENKLYNFTFDKQQSAAVQELLARDFPVDAYLGVQAGHLHRWFNGTAFTKFTATEDSWLSLLEWETSACKGNWINEDYVSATSVFTFKDADGAAPWLDSVWFTWMKPDGAWQDKFIYRNRN